MEINYTFYRLPERSTFAEWERRAPPGFVYAVKGSRFVTHVRRLREPQEGLARFASRARALHASRGPVLWQLDPRFRRDDDRLAGFLRALPRGFQHAIEFRHESWLDAAVLSRLRRRRVALCIPDHPEMPRKLELTTPWTYVRFHFGADGGGYTGAQLDEWGERIRAWMGSGVAVWAYFNNDWEGYAVRDARALLDRLGPE